MNIKTIKAKHLKANVQDEESHWHMRFGNLNFKALKVKMMKEMPPINHLNEACLLDKYANRSFPIEAIFRANKPLELVHTNVCGLITPPSFD